MKRNIFLFLLLALNYFAFAEVRLPKLFGDKMVLQRGKEIKIWGWADKNETVTIQFNKQIKTGKANKNGTWIIVLSPEQAGGPYELLVKGKNSISLKDILIGDVWVCSGQSNMEWPLSSAINAEQEIRSANYPQIRQFKVMNDISDIPLNDLRKAGSWQPALPENVGSFTAIGYFFAREIFNRTKIPIGLINSSWGGTDIEAWISREALAGSDEFKNIFQDVPPLNIDSIAGRLKADILNKLQKLQGGLPDSSDVKAWKDLSFEDSKWPHMNVPGLWEEQALPNFDGVVWFRKKINITGDDFEKQSELHLATIDDADETYINGVKIGATQGYNTTRIYSIPPNILKQGENIIAVRITDYGGGGGFNGEAKEMKLLAGNKSISLSGDWSFQVESIQQGTFSLSPNAYPTLLFNAMIIPLTQFAIKGVIWYQGENNASRAYQYRTAFPLMIQDWRKHWGQDNFPFYFVQLASYNAANGNSTKGSSWAELREAQAATLSLTETGMAVTTDIGESADIHPKNKQDVGKRLAAIALNRNYKIELPFMTPSYQSMNLQNNKVVLNFSNTGSGLMVKDKYAYVRGFEVAGDDHKFYYAKAFIEGNKVVVVADEVKQPVAVRYAWADDASDANLYSKDGFPVAPFRTDTWKGITENVKYKIVQ